MKSIHLIRHADAVGGTPDIERPLSNRGERVCERLASRLETSDDAFVKIFVSPALRAQSTARGIIESLGDANPHWTTDNALYTFEWPDLLGWLESLGDEHESVTIVGHNPAISELAEFLTGESLGQVPPCTFIHISTFVSRWSDLYRECGQLSRCLYPDG
ncbi:MAG: histidine phosphatase family protein [Pseudomonadota bacterium]